ncbi:hypothetical protein [Halomonas sp. M4R1S46]|uniref:hypothetical protein n=1 Tax=Halomonas sp. M4R1S46 TaxID=2982692 RepID=UPI0021E3E1A6|nr:hypothetical protein [Halomonas sp. M4R1S46]UYG06861.1 hypothetical protein OCT48_14700 [Halomonas sp. M4R1S46]
MARLSVEDVARIEAMIRDWRSSKLTWQLVIIACKNELGIETTRKTLLTRDGIKTAMRLRKAELKVPSQATRQFTDIDRANDRIARLTQRVAELEKAQEALIDQFARWAYNADAHGLNEAVLNQPIPKPHR